MEADQTTEQHKIRLFFGSLHDGGVTSEERKAGRLGLLLLDTIKRQDVLLAAYRTVFEDQDVEVANA